MGVAVRIVVLAMLVLRVFPVRRVVPAMPSRVILRIPFRPVVILWAMCVWAIMMVLPRPPLERC